jgi:AcrR family transcriptional regulator
MGKPYHHGDLAQALLRAAEEILEQEGPQGLTLRAVARRAGVSHMAPAHHFGDLSGLLSELAAVGYRQFTARLLAAQDQPGARSVARATGHAYVAFAREKRGLFLLMFRSDRLDFTRPALAEAGQGATMVLARSAGAPAPADGDPRKGVAMMVGSWAVVHGFAMLLIDGRLDGVMEAVPSLAEIPTLLDAAMDAVFSS